MSREDSEDAEKGENGGKSFVGAIVTPIRSPSIISKPAIIKSFRPPAAQKILPASQDVTSAAESATDQEQKKVKESQRPKMAPAAKVKVAKAEKLGKVKPEKVAKAVKDPNLPKAAKSSYMFFSGLIRAGKLFILFNFY